MTNDDEKDNPGHVTSELCLSHRRYLEKQITNMGDKLSFTIKLTGTIIALVVAIIQLGLYFWG